ncbi:ABC transporter related [Parafrankia sp. EAN1pec]|uniref:ABC transporter ATP-binding protein n=1 Tax=Parafrankia sp. (strain EAN1pec) TaxID=298653 RepID=UPI0000540B54|nr:ABC transporter related [Frankia sp. EAN1pec]
MTAAVETTGLGARYGRHWAVRDCTLSLPRGGIVALVGPNGAGKTTLLHLAAGLLRPSTGSIRVLGEKPYYSSGLMTRVGFVAQGAPLYSDFTADELLVMGSKLNRGFEQASAREQLRRLDIPLHWRVGSLPGGQRVQVALTLALGKRPELLLLDEPAAGLDLLARREFLRTLMGSTAEQGATIVLSSHLIEDLDRVCDWLVIMSAGQVQVLGSVEELKARHKVLIGPVVIGSAHQKKIIGVAQVVRASHTDRQSTLLVRTDGVVHDPSWMVQDVSLQDLVLAYLADPAEGLLPGPIGHRSDNGVQGVHV